MRLLTDLKPRRNCAREVRARLEEIEAALADGCTFDQIAREMKINRNTLATHVRVARLEKAARVARDAALAAVKTAA